MPISVEARAIYLARKLGHKTFFKLRVDIFKKHFGLKNTGNNFPDLFLIFYQSFSCLQSPNNTTISRIFLQNLGILDVKITNLKNLPSNFSVDFSVLEKEV